MPAHVLIADADPAALASFEQICRAAGHRTVQASGGTQALAAVRAERPDVCLLDLRAFASKGRQIAAFESAPSIVVTCSADELPAALRALGDGAQEFVEKPAREGVLESVLARVLAHRALMRERELLRREVADTSAGPIVARSPAMRRALDLAERIASTPHTTALVLGEAGVGKALVARWIHERSARSGAPFVTLRCAAHPESRLDAELFGDAQHDGRMAAAEGGTLHFDEVGLLAPELQSKLARVLQERTWRGGDAGIDRPLDVRVIASTRGDLEELVEQGRFREDLYYRLNVMSLRVPPLRERREDLPELAELFSSRVCAELGRERAALDDEALRRMLAHDWPGNVRELRNRIERALILATGDSISSAQLCLALEANPNVPEVAPALPAPSSHHAPWLAGDTLPLGDRSLRALEEALIRRVLQETSGNRKKSAEILGINRTTLYHKLKSYRIDA